jgi:hypothetical protein
MIEMQSISMRNGRPNKRLIVDLFLYLQVNIEYPLSMDCTRRLGNV